MTSVVLCFGFVLNEHRVDNNRDVLVIAEPSLHIDKAFSPFHTATLKMTPADQGVFQIIRHPAQYRKWEEEGGRDRCLE